MQLTFTPDTLDEPFIRSYADQLDIRLPHDEQMAFLQSVSSVELQAAPGSGKTTLLALKLCLLADGWQAPTQGLCVLSHTNTAKDLIIERVGATSVGSKLLGYPHFIGTIQSFIDTFFALPYLRSRGCIVTAISDEQYAATAMGLLRNRQCRSLRYSLEKRTDGEALIQNARYVSKNGKLIVKTTRDLPFSPSTSSGMQFVELKKEASNRGVFRYDDMFAFANQYLHDHPELAKAARARFPFVMIDEMQDTSEVQEESLTNIFPPDLVIRQQVGDINQSIYSRSGARSSVSSVTTTIDLPVSHRFGPSIARVATALTVNRRQNITGTGPADVTALFVFDPDSAHAVIPAFERLVNQVVPKEVLSKSPVRVLGARKQRGTTQHFPQSIACYAPSYAPVAQSVIPATLYQAVEQAQTLWSLSKVSEAAAAMWEITCSALQILSFYIEGKRPTKAMVRHWLEVTKPEFLQTLREFFVTCMTCEFRSKVAWDQVTSVFVMLLQRLSPTPSIEVQLAALLASEPEDAASSANLDSPPNDGRLPTIASIGTIQSAKGETHAATLILECLEGRGRKFDVQEALALIAEDKHPETANQTIRNAVQLVFVGATRPSHMLAFAVRKANLKQQHAAVLEGMGWQIHYL